MLARGTNDIYEVTGQFIANHNKGQAVAQRGEVFGLDHPADDPTGQQRFWRFLGHRPLGERKFLGAIRRFHRDLEHEAVFLRFRERIGTFVFNRVLRREDGEVRRQRIGVAVDRHNTFLHGLQQRRLRFGRSAIDFIRQ